MVTHVVIADDHGPTRFGLCSLVNCEAEDGHTALRLTEELRPHVLLADISMPGPTAIELAAELRNRASATRVLFVSMYEDQVTMDEAMQAGAAGYVTKRMAESGVAEAIRTVASGGTYFPSKPQASAPVQEQAIPELHPLSPDELRLLRCLTEGLSMGKTAQVLQLSLDQTEKQHAELLRKLGLRHRVELISYARQHGLFG